MQTNRVLLTVIAAALAVPLVHAQSPAPAASATQQQSRPQGQPQAPLGSNEWRIDASHSAAHFSVRHMMVTTVRGQLGPISGALEYDGKDVRSIKADVRVDVRGINTQNAKRDDHLRSDDFFDAATHPLITFKSKRVEAGTAGAFKLIGDLTIRNTTKEVVLDVEGPTPPVKGMGGLRVGATATTKIKRLEYGLKWNQLIETGPVVGDEVTVTIDLEVVRPALPGS
jgi:polyisoprenoid-binding protein YceI